jgi:hypothetical protein
MAAKENASPFGPAWRGWDTYRQFAESVRTQLRFVRYIAADRFLIDVLATCGSRERTIGRGTIYWRARLGYETVPVTLSGDDDDIQVMTDEARPYSKDGMKPVSNWQSEGRANPRGIPYLYLATTRDTALAEVRPWIGSMISVAEFRIQRDLRIIDCSVHHALENMITLIGDTTRTREDGMWMAIDNAFATPVTKQDEGGEYIPTQIVAEMFKREGFDGIVYKSLLSEDGYNLALFNLNDADVVQCALYNTGSIRFDFKSEGTEYFVS